MEQRPVHPRRSNRGVIGGLGLVAALVLSGCSGGGAPSAPPAPRPAQPQAAKPAPAAPAPAAAPAPPPYVYEAKDRRDPFRPLIQPKPAPTRTAAATTKRKTGPSVDEIKLTGIIWDRRGAYALVEATNGAGYVLRVNDTIGEDARVATITPEMVMIEVKPEVPGPGVATRKVELRLKKEE